MGAHSKLLLFSTFLFLNSITTRSLSELQALLDLRSSLGISARNWHRRDNPCSNWTGIQCANGHVTRINLSGLRRTHEGKTNPHFNIDSLPNFTFLSSFNSSGFSLNGLIPDWLGYRLSNLQVLDLSSSSILGSIPSSIGNLTRLTHLSLSKNSIAGGIPPALENLQSLSVLDLSQNLLIGKIPSEVSSLGNLTQLDLSSNFLSGTIPLRFSSSLKHLNLSYNSLSGSFPTQLGQLSQLLELDLGYNSLSGSLPVEIGGLKNITKIIIGNNLLDGGLSPSFFHNLTRLDYLDFSSNNLTGFLPNIHSNFTGSVFNISNNHFYGNLTPGIRNFRVVDVSGNYLQGQAPNDDSIILADNCFSDQPSQRHIGDCLNFYSDTGVSFVSNAPDPSPRMPRLPYVMIGVFGGLGLMIILVALSILVLRLCRGKRGNHENPDNLPKVVSDVSGLGVSYTHEQIRLATSDFSADNLIKKGCSGDLFRGELESCDVVVKRIDLGSETRNMSEFVSELELLRKLVHRRLVPVVGHCLEDEHEKFLVYKYMLNRDLSNALYRTIDGEEGLQSLDWITRLKIAIGAAEGLSYLHHECSPPLVHRDIQASSILLDDKYEVRLGSLSGVSVPGVRGNILVPFKMHRTSGRRSSGSSSSSFTTLSHDVYCFGKVLLELVTGKLGISNPNDTFSKQWLKTNLAFISIHEKELMTKIVDQSLVIDEDLLEEVWAVAIVAKSCLNPRASRRPTMRHVLKALENPFKVVRGESFSFGRLRAASSRQSWTAAIFGSWRQGSSGSSNSTEIVGGLRQPERTGSRSSGAHDYSSSHKRSSGEVFPEPLEAGDGGV